MEPDERAVREVHSSWIAAVNAGDISCLLGLMTDDVVFVNPGQAPVGRDGFPDGFCAAHQRARLDCISELENVTVVGEVAYALSRDSVSVVARATAEMTRFAGYRLCIYRKQSDGRWLLARDANTLSPAGGARS